MCKPFNCIDCGLNTLHADEYYMVTDDLWNRVVPEVRGMLCIGCLEVRAGRLLNKDDFPDYPINSAGVFFQSERLQNRLTN